MTACLSEARQRVLAYGSSSRVLSLVCVQQLPIMLRLPINEENLPQAVEHVPLSKLKMNDVPYAQRG